MKLSIPATLVFLATAATGAQAQVAQGPTPYADGGSVSQDYAEQGMLSARYHPGVDIADAAGADVWSPADGQAGKIQDIESVNRWISEARRGLRRSLLA